MNIFVSHSTPSRRPLAVALAGLLTTGPLAASPAPPEAPPVALKQNDFSLTEIDGQIFAAKKQWGDLNTDAIHALPALNDLEHLTIRSGDLEDSALDTIAQVRSLKRLRLSGSRLTDAGVATLSTLTQLRTLDLTDGIRNVTFTGKGLQSLIELKHLRELVLTRTAIDCTHLTGFPHLRILVMSTLHELARVNFSQLAQLTELEILDLSDNRTMDGNGIDHLVDLKYFRALRLNGTAVTNKCVESLTRLKTLEFLDLDGTKIDSQELSVIERSLPNCEVKR